ncbi:PAS domain S-box-containing protein [Fluviicoccus keumensis]|uniref:PAS domain S-box-containing protein n=1 Tax=Fluviicoccus keumensis TaxID=1435465 RepID=A0A4Q7Z8F7_9GAMM|nr:PAS domain-containing protein [Fluviicoccus keumensis]RZU46760.1 PAS domain S-box-containing protein [Fluviicoccus keumensis]
MGYRVLSRILALLFLLTAGGARALEPPLPSSPSTPVSAPAPDCPRRFPDLHQLEGIIASRTSELNASHQQVQQHMLATILFQLGIILLLIVTLLYRRQVQKALLKEKQMISAMLDSSLQFMGLLDLEGRLIHVNHTALGRFSSRSEDVLGQVFWETPWWRHSEYDQDRLRRAILLAVTGEESRFELNCPLQDGESVDVDFSVRPVLDHRMKIINLLIEGRDISARKQAEMQVAARRRELQEANSYLHTLIGALPDTLMELDMDGRIYQFHSPSADFPAPPEAGQVWAIRDFLPEEACHGIQSLIAQAALSGMARGGGIRLNDRQGRSRDYELSVTSLPEAEGAARRFVVLAREAGL